MDAVEHSLDVQRSNRQGRTPQMCATLYLLSIPMRALITLQRLFMLGELLLEVALISVPEGCRAALVAVWAFAACFVDGPQSQDMVKKTARRISGAYSPIIIVALISVIVKSSRDGRLRASQQRRDQGAQNQQAGNGRPTRGRRGTAALIRTRLLKRALHLLPWLIMGLVWMGLKQLARVRITEWRYM